jgi:AcrR family transcriptional regulator
MRRPYHHGNLREALLRGAVRVIAEVGPAAFTLREVARRAGVSHNAPYRHFRDKDALLSAVAAQGFRELTQAMRRAAERETDPLGQLKRSGLAYVEFALRRPEHFTVMFDAPVRRSNDPEYKKASEEAFNTLVAYIRNCQERGQLPSGETLERALYAWSLVHGIAKLATAGRFRFRTKAEVIKFAEFAIDQSPRSAATK